MFDAILKNLFKETVADEKKEYLKQMIDNAKRRMWTSELELYGIEKEIEKFQKSVEELKEQMDLETDKKKKFEISKQHESYVSFLKNLESKREKEQKQIFDHNTSIKTIQEYIETLT